MWRLCRAATSECLGEQAQNAAQEDPGMQDCQVPVRKPPSYCSTVCMSGMHAGGPDPNPAPRRWACRARCGWRSAAPRASRCAGPCPCRWMASPGCSRPPPSPSRTPARRAARSLPPSRPSVHAHCLHSIWRTVYHLHAGQARRPPGAPATYYSVDHLSMHPILAHGHLAHRVPPPFAFAKLSTMPVRDNSAYGSCLLLENECCDGRHVVELGCHAHNPCTECYCTELTKRMG